MIKAVIFDFDGTITRPHLNFLKIKEEIGMSPTESALLERIYSMPPNRQIRAMGILVKHEKEAAENADLTHGLQPVLDFLQRHNIKTALITRNSRASVETVLDKFNLCFDDTITRNDCKVKPAPDAVLKIAAKLQTPLESILLVGDHQLDILAGKAAGVQTVLFTSTGSFNDQLETKADYEINSLAELISIIKQQI